MMITTYHKLRTQGFYDRLVKVGLSSSRLDHALEIAFLEQHQCPHCKKVMPCDEPRFMHTECYADYFDACSDKCIVCGDPILKAIPGIWQSHLCGSATCTAVLCLKAAIVTGENDYSVEIVDVTDGGLENPGTLIRVCMYRLESLDERQKAFPSEAWEMEDVPF
jgi:hypothetical protein